MQVRSALQHKKETNVNKNHFQSQLPKEKKRVKTTRTLKTQQSKSKSKSKSREREKQKERSKQACKQNSQKENRKGKRDCSKSKEKVSPIHIRSMKGYNTSPILLSERDKAKPSPIKIRGGKGMYTERGGDEGYQTGSTKLNTQRTPSKKITESKPKEAEKKVKKSKKGKGPGEPAKKAKKQKCETELKVIKQADFKKVKKVVAPINTQGPQRKQSYFDQQLIQKLNLDNAEFFRRKKPRETSSQTKQPRTDPSTQLNNPSRQEYGTETGSLISQPISYRDLEAFRKEQQLKWRIIYLELSQLKQTRTPEKIEMIIQESDRNISEFQSKCQEIVQCPAKGNYVIESPSKVRDAMTRRRKSSDQSRSLVKTLSDQRLLQELQNLDNLDEVTQFRTNSREQKPSSSSFCIQFQKQMESYSHENPSADPSHKLAIELQHIPELQYQKSMKIYREIQDLLYIEMCAQLAESQKLLHSYLLMCRERQNEQPEEQGQGLEIDEVKIRCSQVYSIDLLYQLFNFVGARGYESQILERVNRPFGGSDLTNLKLLRNYFAEREEDLYQDNDSIEIVIDSDMLHLFESQNSAQPIEGQYFYNHCIYSCFNQLLDSLRPFGLSGPPPLHRVPKPIHKSISCLFTQVLQKFAQLLKVKMGRTDFNQLQLEIGPVKVAEKSYELMDRFLVAEEEEKWRKVQESVFEEKYFLAEGMISDIFNQEIMMIYNEFM